MITLERILSIPKSFYVSWRLTSFQEAFRLPIQVRYNCVLKDLHGKVTGTTKNWKLRIGFEEVGVLDKSRQCCVLLVRGEIRVNGKARLGMGSKMIIADGALLELGYGFFNSATLTIICDKHITFDDGSMIGWDSLVMDTDLHQIMNVNTGKVYSKSQPVYVGKNVWCGTDVKLLKGTYVADGSIVGAGSVLGSRFEQENAIITGNPASVRTVGYTVVKE